MKLKIISTLLAITSFEASGKSMQNFIELLNPGLIYYPEPTKIPEFEEPKNTSTTLVFPIPEGQMNGCNDISWCNEKCKAAMKGPFVAFCSGYCFCDKSVDYSNF